MERSPQHEVNLTLNRIVGNDKDFNSKVNSVHQHILSQLCRPTSATYPSKFLLPANFSLDLIPKNIVRHRFHESIFILQASKSLPTWAEGPKGDILRYLKIRRSLGEQRSIRLSQTFRLTSEWKKIERKAPLSREEFLDLLSTSLDQSRVPVVKEIESFKYDSLSYTIESLNIKGSVTRFLRVESDVAHPEKLIPPFLPVGADVSSNPETYPR